jgi:hypothetical protein
MGFAPLSNIAAYQSRASGAAQEEQAPARQVKFPLALILGFQYGPRYDVYRATTIRTANLPLGRTAPSRP